MWALPPSVLNAYGLLFALSGKFNREAVVSVGGDLSNIRAEQAADATASRLGQRRCGFPNVAAKRGNVFAGGHNRFAVVLQIKRQTVE
jgi:hypothetical protein